MKLVTVEEMRALERAAVEAGISEAQLMAEAGLAVAQEAWLMLGNLEGAQILALAGPGNNGGDAIIAARNLAEWGATVAVYNARARKNDDASDLEAAGITIIEGDEDLPDGGARLDVLLQTADLVIDGLLGVGQARPIESSEAIGHVLTALGAARHRANPPRLIAVDLPSGVNADNGDVDALTVEPDITVTFGLPKVGMYQAPASGHLGRVQVVDIGIPPEAQAAVALELLTARWARTALPARPEQSNKGTFGRVIVVGGSRRYIGAPRLTGVAAYRAGAGLVTTATTEAVVGMLAGGFAESTWLPLEATEEGGIADSAVAALRPEWGRCDAVVLGPGMGDNEATRAFLWAALADIATDVSYGAVLDADALNALAHLDDGPERVPANAVLTPHPGEMARLMDWSVGGVQADRLAAARACAHRYGCVVVLKGAHTVVAGPDGAVRLSPYANPLLATAGSGDVLAGAIAGYLAQGMAPFDAACLGVYVHAAAGESMRAELGDAGLLAGELTARLPTIVRELAQP